MSQPYVGQILLFAGNFPPSGWAVCAGQLMPISENDVLFQLIGTTYGGDGQSTFGIPDMQGRVPIHMGQGGGLSNYQIGEKAGAESVTLNGNQIPLQSHQLLASNSPASASAPAVNTILANENASSPTIPFTYVPFNAATPNQVTMPAASVGQAGGSQPHNNIQPVLAVTVCISLFGIFPTQ
jgi:microcystin-dependent protein